MTKLYYSNTSPYSRKVRIVMIEKDLQNKIEGILVNPFTNNANLETINPLGKIPALVLDNGDTLFDSPLVAQYLDNLTDENKLCPTDNTKWAVLKWEALADGVLDAAYNLVIETRRDANEQSPKWIDIWTNDIQRALAEMEKNIEFIGETVQLSHIAVATAIGYLAFRQPALFPTEQSKLARWYSQFKQRKAMVLTEPQE